MIVGSVPVPGLVLGPEEVHRTVRRLADELSTRHEDGTVLVAVLKGSLLFMADLVREVRFVPEVDFMAVSPYPSGGGRVRLEKDLEIDIEGRDVVLVEDVVDTGHSLTLLRHELERRGPRSLSVCAMVDKRARRLVPVPIEHVGVSVSADYVIGYGLDFAGRYRNLDLIASADPAELARDPDRYLAWAYARRPARR
ncbi:hypoxanthine phosphoribosyltransferase [Actinomarinicola tropica]|uniref:Hypoxanthine phosphoribosyltransferase n=1 Tax=Actinomarinicola tropica TaxID=2789776 RepID=A0A5Q2RME0_9ACTN|nr:hypoxanthine phosphoribosyltransferase [Actinomarinicola tropica]